MSAPERVRTAAGVWTHRLELDAGGDLYALEEEGDRPPLVMATLTQLAEDGIQLEPGSESEVSS